MKHCLLALFLLCSSNAFAQGSLEGDRLALVALYNATEGPNWKMKSGWSVPGSPGDSPCGWYGVTCEGGRVTAINLLLSELNGDLPAEIGDLSQLKSLILGWSYFRDSFLRVAKNGTQIPTELGNLVNLEHLDLSGDRGDLYSETSGPIPFSGSIPASLGNLTKLTYLDLHYIPMDSGFDPYGYLSGSIPATLGNLTSLKYLNFSSQNLTGNLPEELGNLTTLEELRLGSNDFSGSIPPTFGNLISLKILDLSFDYWQRNKEFGSLSGNIPNFTGLLPSAKIYIPSHSFTFAGMEANINRLESYSYQAKLPMYGYFPLSSSSGPGGMLFVEAGGILANNTFKWFKDGLLVATNIGTNYFNAHELGTYRVEVTNSIATQLTLISDDYTVSSLPVTLISFSGKNYQHANQLTWQTTSETNNSGFEIEKSADAKTFEKIGFVDGGGDSKGSKMYSFSDTNPLATTYYRLKQIDYDGKFEYSRIIWVKQDHSAFIIYPNPAANELFVKDLEREEKMTVKNIFGKIVLDQNVVPNQQVSTRSFPNGLYMITIGNDTKKIVIQK